MPDGCPHGVIIQLQPLVSLCAEGSAALVENTVQDDLVSGSASNKAPEAINLRKTAADESVVCIVSGPNADKEISKKDQQWTDLISTSIGLLDSATEETAAANIRKFFQRHIRDLISARPRNVSIPDSIFHDDNIVPMLESFPRGCRYAHMSHLTSQNDLLYTQTLQRLIERGFYERARELFLDNLLTILHERILQPRTANQRQQINKKSKQFSFEYLLSSLPDRYCIIILASRE
ncbi:uncharacterized protein EI97DRAFT_446267 [Westerdykella ornata]|uniref:Uncharacterized protein n=1 Tax=Westerdykella ornata TaxID=318751 RepID=A0A6A6J7A2_WESOR|nr:uncharacterized protein EI97DRAFT_446267 [Westerdykella ornata]KAF2271888.1 hypothetical protein EI97DRAFT_446267 [Westerdykella ornata]